MMKFLMLFLVSIGTISAQAQLYRWKTVSSKPRTFCGIVFTDGCNQGGFGPEIFFGNSNHNASVSREVCETVNAMKGDQCMCMDVTSVTSQMELPSGGNGKRYMSHQANIPATDLRPCDPGSAAQRQANAETAASDQAKAFCAGKSRRVPNFSSGQLAGCHCAPVGFGVLVCP